MSCLICGRTTLPGAKLCADCRAARKRAFAATVTQPLLLAAGAGSGARLLKPSQSVAATARRAAEKALFVKPPRAEPPAKVRASRAYLLLLAAAIGAILLAGAFYAHRLNAVRPASLQVSEQGSAERSAPPREGSGAPAAAQPTPLSELTARAVSDMQAAVPAATPGAKPEALKRASARQRATPAEVSPPPLESAPTTQAIATAPVVAPLIEAPAAPQPDRWQLMNESIARCSGNLIERILCDQRVRREFCDGHWGQVPQCSSSIGSDRGG
jgi:hypothetical protein